MSEELEERKKDSIIAALNRRLEMSEESAERLSNFNAEQTDWYGVCQKCNALLRGTLAELKAHQCNGPQGNL